MPLDGIVEDYARIFEQKMRKKGIRLIRKYPDAALHGADFRIMSALGTGTAAMVDFPAERTERMEPEAASCRDAA